MLPFVVVVGLLVLSRENYPYHSTRRQTCISAEHRKLRPQKVCTYMQNSSSARFLFLDQDMQGIDLLKL